MRESRQSSVSPFIMRHGEVSSEEALKAVSTSSSCRRRLRAAASFAPPSSLNGSRQSSPSCMAVRRRTALNNGTITSGPSLVAIAGPMGITISELNSLSVSSSSSYGGLRTWMVLDYSSGYSSHRRSSRSFAPASGGISCMSFQPSSTSNDDGGSILLAVARGSGILLYDCSGRALNPLLGRLDAQVWDSKKRVIVSSSSGGAVGSRAGNEGINLNNSIHNSAGMGHRRTPSSSNTIGTNGNVNDDNSLLPSGINMNAMNNNNDAGIIPSTTLIAAKIQTGWRDENDDAVTSMDWKPSASVLLATCGVAACVWDLRISSLGGGCVRPNSRFVVRSEDDEYGDYVGGSRSSRSLVHSAFSKNESHHTFATLDSGGVVRVWDDRNPTRPYRSFLACPGGGVGIASLGGSDFTKSRWVTWGMENKDDGDDLVVKVWTESSLPRPSLSRSMTEGVAVRPRSPTPSSYCATSRISMPGGVAARVHPSFHDAIMLFGEERLINNTEDDLGSHNRLSSLSNLATGKPKPRLPSHAIGGGWKAELWSIDAGSGNSSSAVDEHRCVGARMITSFCVDGVEEDALSFARIGGDFSDVMAVDLANGANSSEDELSVCVLTENGRLTIYGVPEMKISKPKPSPARAENEKSSHPALSRVFRQCNDHRGNEWWDKNEEEVLFGVEPNTANISPNKSLAPKSTDNILEHAFVSSIISDGKDSIVEPIIDVVIHPDVASRVPCPPVCGISFSAVGTVATFTNGPVKRMWSLYQSSRRKSTPTSHNMSQIVFLPQLMTKEVDAISDDDDDAPTYNKRAGQQQTNEKGTLLPKTLLDLLEMNRRNQSLQWGDGENDHTNIHLLNDNSGDSSNNSSSKINSGVNISDENRDFSASVSDTSSQSSASDDDNDSEGLYQSDSNGTPTGVNTSMFDAYFSSSRTPLLGGEVEEDNNKHGAFTGFPSLSPSVMISRKHEDILLNGQSPLLAKLLKLGDQWWLTKDFTIPYSTWQTDERNAMIDEQPLHKTLVRPASAMRSSSDSPSLKSSKHVSMMGNLKKLFVNQLPTAMTPPDQRLLNRKSNQTVGQLLDVQKENLGNDGVNKLYPGVYMVNNSPTPEAASQQLAISQKLCFHNARVCCDFGQKGKADTWRLLAQTIESIFTFQMDETNGWGGNDEALTTGLVEQILLYYEGESDYQMLSTIVCVLTLGRDRRCLSSGGGGKYRLLPNFDERRYDNYLHRYAALLYGWDLLTVRIEIEKRIAYATPGAGIETHTWLETGRSRPTLLSNTVTDDDVSHGVEESSLECAICCIPVRGACTWCPRCGHGGHVDHLMQWFQQHSVCPTGCGCVCLTTAETMQ